MEESARQQANRRTVKRLGIAAVAMFGFGFAMVPLYDVFCDITGINGKTGRIELEEALSQKVDEDRLVTVEFLATVHSDLPWEFRPMVKKIKVHPGEVTEVNYYARNKTDDVVTGQAVPSLAPGLAAKYFSRRNASVLPARHSDRERARKCRCALLWTRNCPKMSGQCHCPTRFTRQSLKQREVRFRWDQVRWIL